MKTLLGNCRFCLGDKGLIPLSKAVDFEFTVEDVERYTSIQITDDEQLYCAICDNCCQVFENAVALRITSLSNDVTFKLLLSAFKENLQGDPIAIGEEQTLSAIMNAECDTTEPNRESSRTSAAAQSACSADDCESLSCGDEIFEDIDNNDTIVEQETPSGGEDDKTKVTDKSRELCNICGILVFSYKQHSITHTRELNFCCPYCPKKFARKNYRKLHVEAMHEKKIIKSCEMCGEGFTHRNSYTTHMISKHGVGKKYECKLCLKSYNRSSHYTDHYNKVHGNQVHPCATCGRIFKSKNVLRGHQSVHSDEQPYACSQCPKRFKKRAARKNHELTHTGVRFACQICDKSYRYKTLLAMHYRKDHEGEVPSAIHSTRYNP